MLQNVIVRLQLLYSLDKQVGIQETKKKNRKQSPPKLFSYYVICETHETSTYSIHPISLSHNWEKKIK